MKTAFSVWNDRIAPVFDASRHFWVLDIEDNEIRSHAEAEILDPDPVRKLEKLVDMDVRSLVCGAISRGLLERAAAAGIETIAFIAGGREEVIAAYLAGRLPTPELTMPGCCNARVWTGRCCQRQSPFSRGLNNGQTGNQERRTAMPQGDGTGPLGKGPGTGKGMGSCGKGRQQGNQPGTGRGQGGGQGRGLGKGNKQG